MHLPSGSRIIFIGDSITDAGRDPCGEPSPWLPEFGLGRGYVSQVWAWLTAAHPEAALRVFNKGISGNTVRDLASRWQTDVLDLSPDVLCVMIGINDVWRQFDVPLRGEAHISPEEFRDTLDRLVAQARPLLKQLYLASPFFIEPGRDDLMRGRMDEYGAIVGEISTRHEAVFINTQGAFDAVLSHLHPSALAWDRIHPGPHGHMIIARAFLKAFGCID